ncbi:MAG: zinc-ribbon domain-containing protein [Candidatus Adiutrix sp.]|nr:zinc-ribbon domain-containing protein [Candidatus Adiutrix sp.]
MKLTCPHCRARSSLPDKRLPADGARARCPHCQGRFFIPPLKEGRSPAADREAPTPPEGSGSLEIITVFPEIPGRSPQFYAGTGLAALAVALGALTYFGLLPGSSPSGANAAPWLAPPQNYGREILRDDLISLKRNTFHQKALAYTVDSGPEYRIFSYYLPRLAAGQCREISRVEVESPDPERGLALWGVCLNSNRRGPRLSLNWEGGSASFSGGPKGPSENLRLFPRPKPEKAEEPAGDTLSGPDGFRPEANARRSS